MDVGIPAPGGVGEPSEMLGEPSARWGHQNLLQYSHAGRPPGTSVSATLAFVLMVSSALSQTLL